MHLKNKLKIDNLTTVIQSTAALRLFQIMICILHLCQVSAIPTGQLLLPSILIKKA